LGVCPWAVREELMVLPVGQNVIKWRRCIGCAHRLAADVVTVIIAVLPTEPWLAADSMATV